MTREDPPHAPATGIGKRLLGRFHGTGIFWFQMLLFSGRLLGPRGVRFFEPAFRWFFFLFWGGVRRAVAANLAVVLGPCSPAERRRRVRRTFREFAYCQHDRYRKLAGKFQPETRLEGIEHWEEAKGGVVMITAHIGGWELGSAIPPSRVSRRVHVIREAETDPRAQLFIDSLLKKSMPENYVTHFLGSDPASRDLAFELVRILRQGELLAVAGDRPRHGGRVIEGRLFGKPFRFPTGPAVLAMAGDAILLPVFTFREGPGRYRIRFCPPIEVTNVADAIEQVGREIEAAIREEPYQWFCFREAWPEGT